MTAGFLFAAPAAHATVTCTDVPGGPGSWPYSGYTRYCGSASYQNGSNVASTLYAILFNGHSSGDVTKEAGYILKNYPSDLGTGARFWVFGTADEFSNSGGTGYCNLNPSEFGFTSGTECPSYPSTGIAGVTQSYGSVSSGLTVQYSIIFAGQLSAGATIGTVTAHEAGHWLNYSSEWRTMLGSLNARASDSIGYQTELNQDWDNLNDTTKYQPCILPGKVFSGLKAFNGNYICSGSNGSGSSLNSPYSGSIENVLKAAWPIYYNRNYLAYTATIDGTVTAGDVVTLTISDSSLSTNPQNVSYTVVSGDTLSDIAENLKDNINANSVLGSALITASHTGNAVHLTSRARGSTDYDSNVTGSQTETVTYTRANLEVVIYPSSDEMFAEEFAVQTGNKWGGNQSPASYFVGNKFSCTGRLLYSMYRYGQIPGRTGSIMPWPTGQNCPSY